MCQTIIVCVNSDLQNYDMFVSCSTSVVLSVMCQLLVCLVVHLQSSSLRVYCHDDGLHDVCEF